LVGYTNAGKSTLLNQLANADIYVADKLFATLDPTTRRIELPSGNPVLITDTVGFIQKLPTNLVAAFRATLEEISEANLLIHVLDINNVNAQAQAEAVLKTLNEIDAIDIPILTALNKIDLLNDPQNARISVNGLDSAVAISASSGIGIPDLLEKIQDQLFSSLTNINVFLPYDNGGLISLFYDQGQIERIEHMANGVMIDGKIPVRLVSQFRSVQDHNKDLNLE
jgi:GTP-binding protein HflX